MLSVYLINNSLFIVVLRQDCNVEECLGPLSFECYNVTEQIEPYITSSGTIMLLKLVKM